MGRKDCVYIREAIEESGHWPVTPANQKAIK